MGFGRRVLGAVVVWVAVLGSSVGYGQTDCRPTGSYPQIAGHWKDDLNGEEIDIQNEASSDNPTKEGSSSTVSLLYVSAKYSKEGKVCRDKDFDVFDVRFQTDFNASGKDHEAEWNGSIYWCDTAKTKEGRTYTTGVASGKIHLTESKDGKTLSGYFVGRNGREDISFTRLSKVPEQFGPVVVTTNSMTKIYYDPSTTSHVRNAPPAGTKLIIDDAKTDADGNAMWYSVIDAQSGASGPNSGWIQASKVICSAAPSH
jgi:hypothetical protein